MSRRVVSVVLCLRVLIIVISSSSSSSSSSSDCLANHHYHHRNHHNPFTNLCKIGSMQPTCCTCGAASSGRNIQRHLKLFLFQKLLLWLLNFSRLVSIPCRLISRVSKGFFNFENTLKMKEGLGATFSQQKKASDAYAKVQSGALCSSAACAARHLFVCNRERERLLKKHLWNGSPVAAVELCL